MSSTNESHELHCYSEPGSLCTDTTLRCRLCSCLKQASAATKPCPANKLWHLEQRVKELERAFHAHYDYFHQEYHD